MKSKQALLCFISLSFLVGCGSESTLIEEKPDPVLVEHPVVYIERPVELASSNDNDSQFVDIEAREPVLFNPGAKLVLQTSAFSDAPKKDLSKKFFGNQLIDIRDLSASADGNQFLVSIREAQLDNVDEDEQPSWNIWLYDHPTRLLSRVIDNDAIAERGDDLMASFTPDGRIIFASTRQSTSKAILLDENRPQYTALTEREQQAAFNIHIMEADGANIEQITFNLSHDFYPTILQSGHVLYSRWDAAGGNDKISLYRMNPDGTDNQLVFGWHSQTLRIKNVNYNVDYIKPRQLPSGEVYLLLGQDTNLLYQKRPVLIDLENYIDLNMTVDNEVTDVSAIQPLLSEGGFDFSFVDEVSPSGTITELYPIPDNSQRFLMSWNICRVNLNQINYVCGQLTPEQLSDDNIEFVVPTYELWLYNQIDATQNLVTSASQGRMISEAVIMQESDVNIDFIPDQQVGVELDAELVDEQAGAIHIRSVYDFDGVDTTAQGIAVLSNPTVTALNEQPARFLKIIRGVPLPPSRVQRIMGTDFGRSSNQLMREIVGYTPIQPDGSVKVKIPANVSLSLSIVDSEGRRITDRHNQWFSVRGGETLECKGCHQPNSELVHGRNNVGPISINPGSQNDGVPFVGTTNTIIPSFGQTMAEAAVNTYGLAELSAHLTYQDIWTDQNTATANFSTDITYASLSQPVDDSCYEEWQSFCRLVINYPDHIQPIWLVDRKVYDSQTNELIKDNSCISCHAPSDADNIAQIPAGQLDLSDTASDQEPLHLTSYRELFYNDNEQDVVDGVLIDTLVQLRDGQGNLVFQTDDDGEVILGTNGEPLPVLVNINVSPAMTTAGALASRRFINVLTNSTHQNILSTEERRLIYEWLDIGAQYYNTPFYPRP